MEKLNFIPTTDSRLAQAMPLRFVSELLIVEMWSTELVVRVQKKHQLVFYNICNIYSNSK